MNSYAVSPIEHAVANPIKAPTGRRAKYPWRELAVSQQCPLRGPSFFVACSDREAHKVYTSLKSCQRAIQKSDGFIFAVIREHGGYRVWRTK
jgi:hypothetical protein